MVKVQLKNYCIVCLCVIFFGFFTFSANATTYYVSNSGNDSNSGLTTALTWKTLTKVNSATFQPGDQILFQKGSIFYGTLTIKNSGTAGSPITYGAYGTGANPIITGFTQVTAWTNLGSNIWESTNAVSTLSTCNLVVINGGNTQMGKEPNSGYYYFQSHSGNTSITSNFLTGTPNWTGAELALNSANWETRRVPITSQSGSSLTFTQLDSFSIIADNMKFIIQNDIRTLNSQNEWYYNPLTKKLAVYSTSQPSQLKVSTIDKLLSISGKSYITIQDIAFEGANISSISLTLANNISVKKCSISFTGEDAIYGSGGIISDNLTVEDCTISDSNNGAIGISSYFVNSIIRQNTILNTGMIYGASSKELSNKNEGGSCYGISANGTGMLIESNSIENTGHVGIRFLGNNTIVQKNFIRNFCQINLDGGGIYTWNGRNATYSGRKVMSNIVINNTANIGTVSGIYLDDFTNGIEISDNTLATNDQGIYLHSSYNTLIQRNTVYDAQYGIRVAYYSILGTMYNNVIKNNKIIAKTASQYVFFADPADRMNTAITSNNNIWTRPIAETGIFRLFQRVPAWAAYSYTIPQWTTYSGNDALSSKSTQTISSENDLKFEYNASALSKTISLPYPMVDVKGTKYATSVTLQPYSSIVLMKDANPNLGDVIAPVVNGFSIPASSTSLLIPITTLSASDNVGVTGYLLTETSTKPTLTAPVWSITMPTSYIFASFGTKSLYAWAKDAAGNVSASVSDQVVITLPSTRSNQGNTEVYTGTSTAANRRAMPVTFSETGSIQSISIYHNGGTGNVLLGVYSGQDGMPSTQLGVTSSTLINATAGWQTVSLTSPVTVTAGQTVWLAWVFQNNPGVRYTSGTPGRAQSLATWTGGMPATFGTTTIADNKFSIYCTYTVNVFSTLGNTDVYSGTSTAANRRAIPVTFSEAGTIQSISIYHNGGTGNVLLGVYSDQPGTPLSQLGVTPSTIINTTAGWQTVSLAYPVNVTAGQTIWLAWVFQNNPGVRYMAGTPGRAQSTSTWTGGLPATFGTSTILGNKFSIYCTYTVNTTTLKNANIPDVLNLESATPPVGNNIQMNTDLTDKSSINLLGKNDFKLFPNPAKSFINVVYTYMPERGTTIEIIDGNGKKVFEQLQVSLSNRIDINQFTSGIYIIRSINNQEYNVKKLIIQ